MILFWCITIVFLLLVYRLTTVNKFTYKDFMALNCGNAKRIWTTIHKKCRTKYYPRTNNTVARFEIDDSHVPWTAELPEYKPADFTAPYIKGQAWADPDITDCGFHPVWNSIDGNVNRISHMGNYDIKDSRPLNPVGRTGLCGRGVLGRWGPNHAADPIVTRWKRNDALQIEHHPVSKLPILQMVTIQRRDSGEWAIPGGMVDPGEVVTSTLKREFLEEALNSLEQTPTELTKLQNAINDFFEKGEEVYKGYVDDPRNTDNAWMETVAMNFHDDAGTTVGALSLHAGDDATNVCWMDVNQELCLYASHDDFVAGLAKRHKAHW